MEIDFKTVRALSSPTRVKILHELLKKPTTPTELSDKTSKSKSTVSAHLTKLQEADLIEKDSEDGRKRVVYHPTPKSEAIVNGRERKVKFSIASSAITAFAGIGLVFQGLQRFSILQDDTAEDLTMEADTAVQAETTMSEASSYLISGEILLFIGAGFLTLSLLAFIYGIMMKRLG